LKTPEGCYGFGKTLSISQTTLVAGSGKRCNKLICCVKQWVMVVLQFMENIYKYRIGDQKQQK
jgi:hypothetical protein